MNVHRCHWVNLQNPLYVAYHDTEWGIPCCDDRKLFEMLLMECFQGGLSWECVLNKRTEFSRAFDGFDPQKVVRYDAQKVEQLIDDPLIIRNRRKIEAAVHNSSVFLQIQGEYGTFSRYLWGFTGGKVIREPYTLRTVSPLSDTISADLRRRDMRFVGSTTVYAYLQAVGVINGHGEECDFALCPSETNSAGAHSALRGENRC